MITRYKAADPSDPTSKAEYKVLAAGAQRYWHGTRAAFEQVKDSIPNNTMICITDDNDAPSDLAPLGSVFAYYGSTSPDGYLICDGSKFDTSKYPDLYLFLGSDTLPDLRECTLVGVGQNATHTIAAHDEYTLGQFKDDQLQDHNHAFIQEGGNPPSGVPANSIAIFGGTLNGSTNNKAIQGVYNARAGTTTHGKQVGVNYIIKAVSNMNKSDASALLAQMAQYTRNQNILSAYEDITISTDSANPNVMRYDGLIYVSTRHRVVLYINTTDFRISDHIHIEGYGSCVLAIRKGDRVYMQNDGDSTIVRVAYYKLRDYSDRT